VTVLKWTCLVALLLALTPSARAADGTTMCPDDTTCHFPSPQQCAEGNDDGVWDGGPPGRGSVCAGAAGHDLVYAGGHPPDTCGTVIVADVNVVDGPTAGYGSDPNFCPYDGWPADVHDPSVAKVHGTYYVFGTGPGIPILRSTDRVTWLRDGRVFAHDLPAWAAATIPGTQFPWAPDISYFAGAWHLYYAISTFGSKTSAIGLATSKFIDHGWRDRGIVVRSDETTTYNAIDPNVILDSAGRPWLDFGSFNGGIQVVPLDAATGKTNGSPATIASRLDPTWGIEAPFVIHRGGWYYLFVSFDNCCRGSQSTYNIRVGRSASLGGMYVDDTGVPMLLGGGRLVLQSNGTNRGPGHNAVLREGPTWRLFFHYYDATQKGKARLGILPISWTADGWPSVSWSDLVPATVTK
jgi:arabinan endo-1,5-alpha-L-arabinosidase